MTGKFSEKDHERCLHYARFMSGLTLAQAESLFWILFVFVLVLMCISSIYHHKSINISEREKTLPSGQVNSRRYRRKINRIRSRYLGIVGTCLLVSTMCVIFEAFAAFNIEYCDGEDLMQLYWGFWSILQVGSLIAILGVMLQFWIVMGSHELPSWGVALGTPVLVFAAIGWLMKQLSKRMWARCRGRKFVDDDNEDTSENDDDGADDEEKGNVSRWMSRAPTIVQDSGNSQCPTPDRGGVRRSSTF
ncbi:hypothetical protein PVAG01_05552 [Phlyctema vagabunda]|uniref:Uncharacterized protein n=1 Tax=Phlyctema vagabunda TaxID=108571 RepID=A0ABR4PKF9_9HELO